MLDVLSGFNFPLYQMSTLRRFIPLIMRLENVAVSRIPSLLMQPRLRFSNSSNRSSTLKVLPGCDLAYESADAKPINQPVEGTEAEDESTSTSVKSDKNMSITFTCNVS